MNRFIQYLNLLGIIALAVLCAVQWRTNGQLNRDAERLDRIRVKQDETIKQTSLDLDDSRQRLSISESALTDINAKLTATTVERDQLKANLTKWIAAVAARDDAIRHANTEIQKLSTERNDAVQKYNDLANK